ncbi:hypothetical protein K2173_004075 [Erythroxylum novogranatense]|uniref:Uncharacterized protein n=1 Tax=Erythroxylum novogranatense TaxID=1862640 RepID=A0AAV8SK56_9ROSI|nr:hypothetical protein K2173_004075 [Erythroxylum novogranatense]
MRWERLQLYQGSLQPHQQQQDVNGPGKRWGHTCNSIKGGNFLYVFGGYGRDNCQTNQVHVFDTAKQIWSEPVIKGTPPTPRDSHSCATVGDNLFIFGGTDGRSPLRDLHILDTSSHTWISPSVRGEGPEAREGHSAALVGKRLFIFGGCGKSLENNVEVYYNDLYILNTETFVWKRATTSGTPPSARDSHSCSSWKNEIIVIGGENEHDYYMSDVHVLDAETLVWKELDVFGQKLTPRAGHATVAFGKNLFVFGGFSDAQNLYDDLYMLDVETGVWTKVTTTGDGPSARFSMAGDSLDPLKGGVLLFFGGCNRSLEALDDMYYIHTGMNSFCDEQRVEKLSLRKQLKMKCQEQSLYSTIHEKALITIDTMPSYTQPVGENLRLNQVYYQGKKTFQAKVTETFPHGYSIETMIDGKPLRGILFTNMPSSPRVSDHGDTRKRAGEEVGALLNGEPYNKLKISRNINQDAADHLQPASLEGLDSGSHETKTEADIALGSKNVASSVSEPLKVPGNQESSVAPSLNLNDVMTNDAVNSDAELQNPSTGKDSITLSLSHDGRNPTGVLNGPGQSVRLENN